MLNKRIIPILLLKDQMVVKTIQFQNPQHIGEPIYAIKIFNDYEVDELIIVDITLSRSDANSNSISNKNKIPFDLISKISDESCMPITYGGGIRSINDASQLFKAGIEKIAINTSALTTPNIVTEISNEFGRQSVVISIDVRKNNDNSYFVYSNGGQQCAHIDPVTHALNMQSLGAGEILINSIDRDGTMTGYDIPLIRSISSTVKIPVIALGGAAKEDDFCQALHQGGASAAAAGSMFVYYGKKRAILINYPDRFDIEKILEDRDQNESQN